MQRLKIVEKIIANVSEKDPFRIKDIMLGAIETGNLSDVLLLKSLLKNIRIYLRTRQLRNWYNFIKLLI